MEVAINAVMRINRILLIVGLIVWLSATAWAQASPTPSEEGTTYNEVIGPNGTRQRTKVRALTGPLPWRVEAIKLIAPGVGWAAAGPGLLWTTDNGVHWKNITPSHNDGEVLGRVFFLDRSRAWMTINQENGPSDKSHFDIASTTDTGSTWTRRHFTLRPKDYGISSDTLYGGAGNVAFSDPLNGWLSVGFSAMTMNSWWSFLLTTSDGGRSWKRATEVPELQDSQVLIVSPTEGWLYGPHGEGLYRTGNRARTWQEVAPNVDGMQVNDVDALPTFIDSRQGFLPVRGTARHGSIWKWARGMVATADGGKTWKLDCIVENIDQQWRSRFRDVTVAGSTLIFAAQLHHEPVLTELTAGQKIDAGTDPLFAEYRDIRALSFATPKEGWVVIGDGQLLSTTDGGKTWTDITPRR